MYNVSINNGPDSVFLLSGVQGVRTHRGSDGVLWLDVVYYTGQIGSPAMKIVGKMEVRDRDGRMVLGFDEQKVVSEPEAEGDPAMSMEDARRVAGAVYALPQNARKVMDTDIAEAVAHAIFSVAHGLDADSTIGALPHDKGASPVPDGVNAILREATFEPVGDKWLAFGRVYNDRDGRFHDGAGIHTSYIRSIEPQADGTLLVHTRNSVYIVVPSPDATVPDQFVTNQDAVRADLESLQRALDTLGLALADEAHVWTVGERRTYEQATATIRRLLGEKVNALVSSTVAAGV